MLVFFMRNKHLKINLAEKNLIKCRKQLSHSHFAQITKWQGIISDSGFS